MTTRIRTVYRGVAMLCIAVLLAVSVYGDLPLVGGGMGATTQRAPGFVPPEQRATSPATLPSIADQPPLVNVTDEQVGESINKAVGFLLSNFERNELKAIEGEGGAIGHAGLNDLCVYALLQAQQATRDSRLSLSEPFMKGVLDEMKHQRLESRLDAPSPVVFARALRAAALAVNNRAADHNVLVDDVMWLIKAHRDGSYTDDDNRPAPAVVVDAPPPPRIAYSTPTGGMPRQPAAKSPPPGPMKLSDLKPSPIPNLQPSRIPNLSPSRIVLVTPGHICIPGNRGVFLRGPSSQPSGGGPSSPFQHGRSPTLAGQHAPAQAGDVLPYSWDAGNSQFGLLGVWAGAETGIEVPNSYWTAVQNHWLRTETQFGTWSYSDDVCEPSIGPTWGGDWALLVTHDWLGISQRPDQLGRRPYHPGLVQAFKWLETANNSTTIKDEQTNFVGYNLFMLERIGQASGFKYFGSHDWYRELCARVIPSQWPNGAFGRSPHGYDAVTQTAYTLLFLASGRNPIFMEKLRFEGNWANRPRDVANLTRFAARELEHKLNWEVVPLNREWTDWLDSPVLYIASHEAPKFVEDDLRKLRSYAQAGGVLFTHADAGSKQFTDYVEQTLAGALFPQYPMQDIPENDPIYSIQYKIDGPPAKLRGISNGSRWLLVHTPVDLGANWQIRSEKTARKSFELAVNLFVYASGKRELHNRLATTAIPSPAQAPTNSTQVVRLKYAGNWDPEPYAWQRADRWMQANAERKLDLQTVAIADLKPDTAKLAVLTGNAEASPTEAEVAALKSFVESGGWLLIDDCGGGGKFAAAVESQWLPKLTAEKLAPIPSGDPLLGDKAIYRDGTVERLAASCQPRSASVGKGRIIYSSVDITTGLLGASTAGILGYQPASALALARNVVLESGASK